MMKRYFSLVCLLAQVMTGSAGQKCTPQTTTVVSTTTVTLAAVTTTIPVLTTITALNASSPSVTATFCTRGNCL
ncbi:hypothetical protein CPC08DRAFT_378620 [Agrocybe pediades]|nr:hypothetical protein CPC08DRAFT_378620 [Agrocybe pediades]